MARTPHGGPPLRAGCGQDQDPGDTGSRHSFRTISRICSRTVERWEVHDGPAAQRSQTAGGRHPAQRGNGNADDVYVTTLRWVLAAIGTVLVGLVGLVAFTAFRWSSWDRAHLGATDAPHVAAVHALIQGLPPAADAAIDEYQTGCMIATDLCETSTVLSPEALITSVQGQL